MKVQDIFILMFFSLFIIFNVGIGLIIIKYPRIMGLFYFIFLEIINIGIAYHLSELGLATITKKIDLPKLSELKRVPQVAILYVTFNDMIPQLLDKLKEQNYPKYDIFVLDDSTDEFYQNIIDSSGFTIVRRTGRKGFKAGILNHWLKLYGNLYEYFIIADSDSSFDKDFIQKMVLYGEHSSNSNIAIFQSKIINNNTYKNFSRVIGISQRFSMYIHGKLGNSCSMILSWGHNNIHRTRMIQNVGGFDEQFIAEDYALALKLIKNEYSCKIVDVVTYDYEPESAQNYSKRYIRWAKQTIQLLKINKENVPFITQLYLFIGVYSYLLWIVISLGIIVSIWCFTSSINDFLIIFSSIVSGMLINSPYYIPIFLLLLYLFYFAILRIPLAVKLGISARDYFEYLFLSLAISNYMLIPLIYEEIKMIISQKLHFDVTLKKYDGKRSLIQILKEMKIGLVFNSIAIIGLVRNPVYLLFNFIWLIPFLFSPIVIYILENSNNQPI